MTRPDIDPARAAMLGMIVSLAVAGLAAVLGQALLGAAIVAIAVAIGGFTYPMAGIVAVVLLLPIHPLAMRVANVDFGVDGSALLLLSAWKEIAVLVVLARFAILPPAGAGRPALNVRGRMAAPDLLAIALVALIGLVFASGIANVVPMNLLAGVNQVRLLLFPVAIYLAMRWSGRLPADLLTWFVAVLTGVAAFGIAQGTLLGWGWVTRYFGTAELPIPYTFVAVHLDGPRATGTLASPNEFAFVIGAGLVCAVWLMSIVPRNARIAVAFAIFTMIVGLGLSFSRTAILGAGVGAIVLGFVLVQARAYQRQALSLLVGAALIAGVVTLTAYQARGGLALIASTIASVSGELDQSQPPPTQSAVPGSTATPRPAEDPSTAGHRTSLTESARLLMDRPLGVGLGNVGVRVTPGTSEKPTLVVESWYLALGLILGWPGTVWAVLLTAMLAVLGWRARRPSEAWAILGGLAFLVAVVGLLLPTMLEPQAAYIPWLIVAIGGLATTRVVDANRHSTS